MWEITANGEVIDSGKVSVSAIAPRRSAGFNVKSKHLKSISTNGDRFISFTTLKKSATEWAPANTEMGWEQFALPSKGLAKPKISKVNELAAIIDENGEIHLPHGATTPQLTLFRAPTDNDRIGYLATKWQRWGVDQLHRSSVKVVRAKSATTIKTVWETSAGISIKHTQIVEPIVAGLRVTETVTIPKILDDLGRIGTTFELHGEMDQLEYFGAGPHESYPDRRIGKIHRWKSKVSEQYVPYVRPQENGGHNGVRWFSLTGPAGEKLQIRLGKPSQVSVVPHRAADIATATHDVELKPSGNVVITIDSAHRGIGTASCGPDTLPKYRIKPGVHTWSWTLLVE